MPDNLIILRGMVRGTYDLQQLRIAAGLRLCANFRAKLGVDEIAETEDEEANEAVAAKIIAELKESYRRLTDGIAKNRTLPARNGFVGDENISTHAELVLVHQYFSLLKEEEAEFRQMQDILDLIPVYVQYLSKVKGIGPAIASVLITAFDITKARNISSFWRYAGLDVVDGIARKRIKEHFVEKEYVTKSGEVRTGMALGFDPWLKAKLLQVLGGSFIKHGSVPWRQVYDGYKHRIESDPTRVKCTANEWKKKNKAGEPVAHLWTPGRINAAAKRYMVKQFLAEFWANWRKLEGLPVTEPYAVGKLGMRPHKAA